MKIFGKTLIPLFLAAIMLASCNSSLSTPTMSADTYAARIVPLQFSTDIESASGAFFNQKAIAILPSEIMTSAYVDEYMEASDKLLMRVLQNVSTT